MAKTINVAIVGLGYWGPNWLRNFASLEECTVQYGCDLSKERCRKFTLQYPSVTFTNRYEDLLEDASLDAIVIATPTKTHADLAKRALTAGKHVLIEKPMTASVAEADQLVTLAKKRKRCLLTDHTFAYTQAVDKILQLKSRLGSLLYFDSTRINLGLIQKDTSVFYDLAVHDLTILSALRPLTDITEVFATGQSFYGKTIEMGHIHLKYADRFNAHIHVSWLSPVKIRSTLIAGKNAMIVYDDTQPSEKIRLYDRGIDHDTSKPDPFFPKYRSGDVLIPAMSLTEALETQARHFLACIRGTQKPIVSGADGRDMVRLLSLIDQSCAENRPVSVR